MNVAPRTPRAFFERIGRTSSLEEALSIFDGADPWQTYFAMHGKMPDTLASLRSASAHFQSPEFRARIIQNLCNAFPGKRRLLFIHIPKTAGSELSGRLMDRYPFISQAMLQPGWRTDEEICTALRRAAIGLPKSPNLLVCGHITLSHYQKMEIVRYDDSVFAVLREPQRLVLSTINYVIGRMMSKAPKLTPDIVGWRKQFGDTDDLPRLASRILRDTSATVPNLMCRYLGGTTAQAALEKIACFNVELTDMSRLDRWCSEKWGIEKDTRSNISKRYVTASDLTNEDLNFISEITKEDQKLYNFVTDRLDISDVASISGASLA